MNEFIEKLITILDEEFECYPMVEISERIRQLAEEYKGGWILTSERLPDKDGNYLITSNGRVYEAYYQDGFWLDPIEFYRVYRSVTAWQPLPAPYSPKGE